MENIETKDQITIELNNSPYFIVGTSTYETMCKDLTPFMHCADQVKSIYVSGDSPFNIEDLKVFLNLEQLHNLTGILTHDELYKIQQFFPHLKTLIYNFADEEILADYYDDNSINFEIITTDPKFSIKNSDNPFFSDVKYSRHNNKFNLKKINFVEINRNVPKEQKYLEELYKYTREIEILQFDYTSFDDIISFVNKLKSKNIKINTIYIKCENKTYPNINALKNACKECDVRIDYTPYPDNTIFTLNYSCTIEEFITLRATIDYYLKLIKNYDLSPFEQTIFVYDIIKSLDYNEDKHQSMNSRLLHKIIQTGNIVCAGYCSFIVQLLKELGIIATYCPVYCPESPLEDYHNISVEDTKVNHARALVKLDDKKYNIHGVFCEDVTFDSCPSDNFNIYNYFLLNCGEYNEIFPRDTLPELFHFYLHNVYNQSSSILSKDYIFENLSYYGKHMLTLLFGANINSKLIAKYIECEPISLETFLKALRVVRRCEGYPEDSIETEINEAKYYFKNPSFDIEHITK